MEPDSNQQSKTSVMRFKGGQPEKKVAIKVCSAFWQLSESTSCFPWAYSAQCFFAVGLCGQSLLLFLFELAAGVQDAWLF